MNNVIIGTAGHVDHGKTRLIERLTNIDTDRLSEEKRRGITIDLGYAYIDLPKAGRVGIVDVPGHEKFIKNMLSGVGGIKIALLVVAADELFMPQTREHLDILGILGITDGVVALTKIDLIPDELRDMTISAVRDELAGTALENAGIIPVSSVTGEGIDTLKEALDNTIQERDAENRGDESDDSAFFMPIDRSFSIKGHGTVVTGSVWSGTVNMFDKYMLYPEERLIGIRNIQVHSENVEEARGGERCAINLKDIKKDEIERGNVLGLANSLTPAMMLDVKVCLLENAMFEIANESTVHFYYGAGEYIAKVVLMDRELLRGGEEAYAQLRFKERLVARKGDRFVIRFLSPAVTIGGGIILDANPIKHKRNKENSIESFRIKENASFEEQLYEQIRENYRQLRHLSSFSEKEKEAIETMEKDGKLLVINNKVITSERVDKLWNYALGMLSGYHRLNFDLPGIPTAEFKVRLLGDRNIKEAAALVDYWKKCEKIKEAGMCISLYDFELVIPKNDEVVEKRIMRIYNEAGLNPPAYNDIKPLFLGSPRFLKVLNRLIKEEKLVKLDNRYIVAYPYYEEALKRLKLLSEHTPNGDVVLGEYRDRIKSSRKMALALLEYFDDKKITIMDGERDVRQVMQAL